MVVARTLLADRDDRIRIPDREAGLTSLCQRCGRSQLAFVHAVLSSCRTNAVAKATETGETLRHHSDTAAVGISHRETARVVDTAAANGVCAGTRCTVLSMRAVNAVR